MITGRTPLKEKLLVSWGNWVAKNPVKTILFAGLLTIILMVGFAFLKMEMTFFSIMPQSSPQVRDLKRITEIFPYSSNIVVVIDGRQIPDKKEAERRVKKTVDDMEMEFGKPEYEDIIAGVNGKLDRDFIKRNGLLITKTEDLSRMKTILSNLDLVPYFTHLNDDLEREYAGNEEKMKDDESYIVSQFRGLNRVLGLFGDYLEGNPVSADALSSALDDYIYGESYFLNKDNTMALFIVRPTFTVNDVDKLVPGIARIEKAAVEIAKNNGVDTGLTGMSVVGKDEMVTSQQGFYLSMLIAFILIIVIMILVFRMKSVPFITGIPLFTGILWTAGLTGYILHRLNIMTAMYMVALLGLGIDYAVHLLTTYIQERDSGKDFTDSLTGSLRISGPGIITGALTTALAFFALIISKTEMVRELAVVAGTGILCEMVAMFILIPALLSLRYNYLKKRGKQDVIRKRKIKLKSSFTGGIGKVIGKAPIVIALVFMAAGIALSSQSGEVSLEDNIMNMEAKGLKSIELQDLIVDEFEMAPDTLYIITGDIEEVRYLTDTLDDLDSVKDVESVTLYLPSSKEYEERVPILKELRNDLNHHTEMENPDHEQLLDEIYRLESNLFEMNDLAYLSHMMKVNTALNEITGVDENGKKIKDTEFDRLYTLFDEGVDENRLAEFQVMFSGLLGEKIWNMTSTDPLTPSDLPEMVRDSYMSEDGSEYLINIIPTMNPWIGDYRSLFMTQIRSVTDKGTGMILVADQLNEMAETDGIKATIAALIAVFFILLLDFRNLKLTALTFLPLALSFGSLFGLMGLFHIKLDFLNIISIPLLIGIGIDYAVHINHRYLLEGKGGIGKTVAMTGTAIFLTSLTTIIGFASFIPSIMRAMRSTGIVLTLAISLAFLYSLFLHPAVLVIVGEKWKGKLTPWGKTDKEESK